MPSVVTHHYFAKDSYDKLKSSIQRRIDPDFLKVTAQGPDIFFYDQMYSLGINQKANLLAGEMSRKKTRDYIINMAKYIKQNHLANNRLIMTYLYGSVMHMILDATIHPYIFYKTGVFNKKRKSTFKYNGLHTTMETFLDCYMVYTRESILPHLSKNYHILDYKIPEDIELSNFMDSVIKDTYNFENAFKVYKRSLKADYFNHRFIRHDPLKLKKYGLKLMSLIFRNNFLDKSGYCYSLNFKNRYHYLNLEKNEWNHPALQTEYYKYSFIELYVMATHRAVKLIEEIDVYFTTDKDLRYLSKKIPNISYITGKDLDEKQTMKYFEY